MAKPKGIRQWRGGGVLGVGDGRRGGTVALSAAASEKLCTHDPKTEVEAPAGAETEARASPSTSTTAGVRGGREAASRLCRSRPRAGVMTTPVGSRPCIGSGTTGCRAADTKASIGGAVAVCWWRRREPLYFPAPSRWSPRTP
ncbi:uncharacterized protein LOC123411545 [Hordeum vulgare subsp. vulgare]|uniref:Predicted protein n=1 Tax=Hordeum vulgare subsp. vulgare TaxID=112509 RepID=F2CTX2_HORVV|nr:uncharacterized protein LOC123411545 [Hordeum vulgare subsp. vulgare]BAJ86293.1 predicted protein [Hordeum vulgare subsp. vulgare]